MSPSLGPPPPEGGTRRAVTTRHAPGTPGCCVRATRGMWRPGCHRRGAILRDMPQQLGPVSLRRPDDPFPSVPAGDPSRRRARVSGRPAVIALLGLLVFLALALTPGGFTGQAAFGTAAAAVVPVGHDSGRALAGFMIQSTARVTDPAAEVSGPGYPTKGWYRAGPRSTVLAALLAAGVHPDPFHSTNQKLIPAADFTVPWWYRSDFTVDDSRVGRTYLDFSGVTSAADVFVNGRQVSTAREVAGTYTRHELDVTALVRPGTNTVAFRVQPNDPRKHLTVGWLDWLQPPPDRNMGIVRDVVVRRSGPVALRDAHVVTDLDVPSLASADLTVKARLRNDSPDTVTATLSGTAGPRCPQPAG
ncbi:hypothetical protein GCM10020295_03350 [Streptomyces cinereospinus]